MKKYFLIFTFLFLIPTVSLAEKKNNKLTLSENEWKKLLDESYFMGMYDGHVMNACAVYLLGKIDKELTDIEFGSKKGNPETISLFDE